MFSLCRTLSVLKSRFSIITFWHTLFLQPICSVRTFSGLWNSCKFATLLVHVMIFSSALFCLYRHFDSFHTHPQFYRSWCSSVPFQLLVWIVNDKRGRSVIRNPRISWHDLELSTSSVLSTTLHIWTRFLFLLKNLSNLIRHLSRSSTSHQYMMDVRAS